MYPYSGAKINIGNTFKSYSSISVLYFIDKETGIEEDHKNKKIHCKKC
jgi:hypothetical protein